MINISNLTKSYKKRIIFDDVNVVFHKNSINYLIGANGSGKTTLIKCLIDLEIYKGRVSFGSKSLEDVRKKIGVVFDDPPFYPNQTGFVNLKLLFNHGKLNKNLVMGLSEKLMLREILHNKVKFYSYGERKKLSLLLAMLSQPSFLILDEISNGLDYDTMVLLQNLLSEWTNTMTIIVTGHHYEFYKVVLNHLYVIKNNGIQEVDNLDEEIKGLGNNAY